MHVHCCLRHTSYDIPAVMVWYGMVWYGMVWYGMVWYGMVWYGMVCYGMEWYDMAWYGRGSIVSDSRGDPIPRRATDFWFITM